MAKYKITAPESAYVGSISGVQFRDGVAEADDIVPSVAAVLDYCRNAGYLVERLEEPGPTKEPEDSGPFDPAKHGAPAVLDYLATADEPEAARVLDAEAEGKARKGIVEQRDAILARARENAPKENDQ